MKQRIILTILIVLPLLSGCTRSEKSLFFEDCSCVKLDFDNGKTFTDSLGHYSVRIPNGWFVTNDLFEGNNGVTGSDTTNGYYQVVAITEQEYDGDILDHVSEIANIKRHFNVLDEGIFTYKNQACDWRLVKFDRGIVPLYTIFVTRYKNNRMYTINMSVEQGKNYRQKLCRLESFLDHFEIH